MSTETLITQNGSTGWGVSGTETILTDSTEKLISAGGHKTTIGGGNGSPCNAKTGL